MWAWMNGEFVKAEELRISPFDHGFLYGLGFFETFRTYDGEPFLLEEHLKRLQLALDEFRIDNKIRYRHADIDYSRVERSAVAEKMAISA